jgi:hypothetical protein
MENASTTVEEDSRQWQKEMAEMHVLSSHSIILISVRISATS